MDADKHKSKATDEAMENTKKINESEVMNTQEENNKTDIKYKRKKIVRKRKAAGKSDPLEHALRLTLESGKVVLGHRQSLDHIKVGDIKAIIIASNARQDVKQDIDALAKESNIPVYIQKWTSLQLGTICGKPYPVSALGIISEGTSNILEIIAK